MTKLDATHDPKRRSFVESANHAGADFPLQNLPFGIFRRGGERIGRGGVAIGDRILDLRAAREAKLFTGLADEAAAATGPKLNGLLALGRRHAAALRVELCDLLDAAGPRRAEVESNAERLLVPLGEAEMEMPAHVGNFTDFLTSSFHSTRLSPTGKLTEAFMSMPIAYHSRASSVRISGGTVRRPHGQWTDRDKSVRFEPSRSLDYELEVGAFVGLGNGLGEPIPIGTAADHIFGFCLLNDWSVRDVQRFESVPLGPFLAKSLSTSISPWVVTQEAMAPFRAPAFRRGEGEPPPLPHLSSREDQESGGFDLTLLAYLRTKAMREAGKGPVQITETNFKHMYWTFAQMLTHHASNGCNLQTGDIIASGTTSGPTDDSRACLAEITERGRKPLALPNGETRGWLEDGDEVIFRARAMRHGFVSIGFGECTGVVGPAMPWPDG